MKKHITHHDDCGCLTERYKILLNGFMALDKHQKIVCEGFEALSTTSHIINKTIDNLNKFDESLKA